MSEQYPQYPGGAPVGRHQPPPRSPQPPPQAPYQPDPTAQQWPPQPPPSPQLYRPDPTAHQPPRPNPSRAPTGPGYWPSQPLPDGHPARRPKLAWYRRGWVPVAALVIGFLFGIAAASAGTSAPTADLGAVTVTSAKPKASAIKPTTAAQPAARVLFSQTGSGIKKTRAFTVDGSWEIRWNHYTQGAYFGIYVQQGSGTVDVAANTTDAGVDVWPGTEAGTYYLQINATGRWKVVVIDTE